MSKKQVTVKCLLQKDKKKDDIRVVTVDKRIAYDDFIKTIGKEYGHPVRIKKYKDHSGDLITVGRNRFDCALHLNASPKDNVYQVILYLRVDHKDKRKRRKSLHNSTKPPHGTAKQSPKRRKSSKPQEKGRKKSIGTSDDRDLAESGSRTPSWRQEPSMPRFSAHIVPSPATRTPPGTPSPSMSPISGPTLPSSYEAHLSPHQSFENSGEYYDKKTTSSRTDEPLASVSESNDASVPSFHKLEDHSNGSSAVPINLKGKKKDKPMPAFMKKKPASIDVSHSPSNSLGTAYALPSFLQSPLPLEDRPRNHHSPSPSNSPATDARFPLHLGSEEFGPGPRTIDSGVPIPPDSTILTGMSTQDGSGSWVWNSDTKADTVATQRTATNGNAHVEELMRSDYMHTPMNIRRGKKLGVGAFGTVYVGMNNDTGTMIAIKVLEVPKGNSASVKKQISTFKREIDTMKSLNHKNIVRYLGCFVQKAEINIYLEYVAGGSLRDILSKFGALSEVLVKLYSRQILGGLSYLHARKVPIVHRDIKGANILVDTHGVVKLADFGCSKSIETIVTREAFYTMLGTPYWMAPEVMNSSGHGRPADIWSFGCTIIEMATGKPPFEDIKDFMQLFHQVGNNGRKPRVPDNLTQDAKDFLGLCFKQKAHDRATATELLQHIWLNLDNKSLKRSLTRTQQMTMSFFSDSPFSLLPTEIAVQILKTLQVKDVLQLCLVCKHWQNLTQTWTLWKAFVLERWPKLQRQHIDNLKDYTTRYKELHMYDSLWSGSSKFAQVGKPITLKSHKQTYAVRFLEDGTFLTGGEDKKLRIWEEDPRKPHRWRIKDSLRCHGSIHSIYSFSPTDNVTYTGDDDYIRVWEIPTRRQLEEVRGHHGAIMALDGHKRKLVSSATDAKINLWNVDNGAGVRLSQTIDVPKDTAWCLKLWHSMIASGGAGGTIQLRDARSKKLIKTYEGHTDDLTCLHFEDNVILSGSKDGTVKEWNSRQDKCLATFKRSGDSRGITSMFFDKRNNIITGDAKGVLRTWNYNTEKWERELSKAHTNAITGMDWHPDELSLVTIGKDKTIRLWTHETDDSDSR